ncbi:MAG: hypothetical protein BWZ06_01144 [Bacteroidetes bacterium ADurb.BinA261]|nr:MAG: hypothetical protein BWZ06_01144 [Bacteroidetes bacterium ADurb.BinA261]
MNEELKMLVRFYKSMFFSLQVLLTLGIIFHGKYFLLFYIIRVVGILMIVVY